jgi:hypothetical protein
VVLLGAVSFLGAQAWQDLPVTECGDNHLAPLKVQIEEMPVKAGGKLSLQLSFTPDRDITGGKVKVDAKLELLDLSVGSVSFDVCTQLGVSCPLKAGVPAVGTISYDVPSIAPKSTIDAHVTATDDKNVQLACFDAKVQVVHPWAVDPEPAPLEMMVQQRRLSPSQRLREQLKQ